MWKVVHALILVGIFGCSTITNLPTIDEEKARIEAKLQRISSFKKDLEYSRRLHDVSFSILKSNVLLCADKTRKKVGIEWRSLDFFKDKDWKETARGEFGIGNRLTVISVAKDSPAEVAGLLYGDRVVGINNADIGSGKKAQKKFLKLLRKYENHESVMFNIEREGAKQDIEIEPVLCVDYSVSLTRGSGVNAWADGKGIVVTTGMMDFVDNDDDLALVIGHELAHNTCGHIKKKKGNIFLGTLLGTIATVGVGIDMRETGMLAGAQMFSQSFEAEADYVGVYFASRAGFDANNAASLWRRMGESHPYAINLKGSSHPSTAKRFLAIKATVEEINLKKEKGLMLIPNPKKN